MATAIHREHFLVTMLKKEIFTAKELDLRPLGKVIIFRDTQNLLIIYRLSLLYIRSWWRWECCEAPNCRLLPRGTMTTRATPAMPPFNLALWVMIYFKYNVYIYVMLIIMVGMIRSWSKSPLKQRQEQQQWCYLSILLCEWSFELYWRIVTNIRSL